MLANINPTTTTAWQKLNDYKSCLLYTSDAADERSSVDLGGRRIIKKKKNECRGMWINRKKEQKLQEEHDVLIKQQTQYTMR